MSCEVVWLPEAARDVARLRDFIREKNPDAAGRASERIKGGAQLLQENPEAGKPVKEALPFRDLLIPFGSGNYIMRYRQENREEGCRVVIVRVRHSRENGFT